MLYDLYFGEARLLHKWRLSHVITLPVNYKHVGGKLLPPLSISPKHGGNILISMSSRVSVLSHNEVHKDPFRFVSFEVQTSGSKSISFLLQQY